MGVDQNVLLQGSDCWTLAAQLAAQQAAQLAALLLLTFFFQLLSSDLLCPLSTSGLRFLYIFEGVWKRADLHRATASLRELYQGTVLALIAKGDRVWELLPPELGR